MAYISSYSAGGTIDKREIDMSVSAQACHVAGPDRTAQLVRKLSKKKTAESKAPVL